MNDGFGMAEDISYFLIPFALFRSFFYLVASLLSTGNVSTRKLAWASFLLTIRHAHSSIYLPLCSLPYPLETF